ncbi:MAG: dihydrodipicolinate synthase family protein [Burkholderiaceae bacterium]
MQRFTGIHTMLYALFDDAEQLSRASMRRQVGHSLAAGCDGICILGLATEVQKLSSAERYLLVEWAAQDLAESPGGANKPLGVTIAGNSVAEQIALARHAVANRADWIILQPPAVGTFGATEYIRFFGRVADAVDVPVAVQNAPAYLGRGLSADDIAVLITQHPNITHLKGEDSAVQIERIIQAVDGRMTVLNGRAGLELTDNLRAGCEGFILAADTADVGIRVLEAWGRGDCVGADAYYRQGLPAITFVMQSLEHLITYGKRLYGLRVSEAIYDRAPCMAPTSFGVACVQRWADDLGRLGGSPE